MCVSFKVVFEICENIMYPNQRQRPQRGGGRQQQQQQQPSANPRQSSAPGQSSSSPSASAFARGVALISPRGILNQSRRFFDDYQRRRERIGFGRQPRYRPLLAREEYQDGSGFQPPRFLSSWLRGPGGVLLLFSIVSLWFTMRTLDQFTHQTHVDHRDKHVSRKFCEERNERAPLICAHGGLHGGVGQEKGASFPNTVSAFVAASREGFECVEVDVSRTRDNELVCLHSRELKAITNNKFERVQDVTLDVIRMHAKKKGVWISTFREVVDQVVNRGFKQVTIDVKDDPKAGWSGLPEQIFETVFAEDSSNHNGGGRSSNNNKHNSKRSCEECVFWGKTDAMLRKFIEFDGGKHKVGYTVANFSRALRDEGYHELSINRPLGAYCVAIQSEMAEEEKLVRDANDKLGLKTFAWTVSDARRVRKLANNNVDGIVTDDPLIVRNVFEKMRRDCLRGSHHVRDERL